MPFTVAMEVFWFCSVFGAGLCEPHLFALVAFLVEEFGQRVFVGSVVFGTMAEDVDSGEDGMTEAGGVCYSLSCYVVCRAVVGTMRPGCTSSASFESRSSGTVITPTLGSMVQKGKLADCALALLRQLNKVDLPTLGSPTMPHCKLIFI